MNDFKQINWGYLALALALAIMLWGFVTIQDNPQEERLFEVPVDYINLADNLAISDKPSNIKLRLNATSSVLDNLSASDINAYADLSGATLGQYTARLNFDLPAGVQLSSAERSEVTVLIDELAQVQHQVQVEYTGTAADGYMTLPASVSPTEIVLSGPEDKLALINKVFISVNLDEANSNYRASLPVNVQDSAGNSLLHWITPQPAMLDVLVPVVSSQPSKTVPVNVTLSGQPANGYVVSRIVADPAVAVIMGAQKALDNVDYVYTSAININGATNTVTEEVTLLNANGVTVDTSLRFKVMVVIEREETTTVNDVVVSLTNTNAAYNYNLSTNTVDVVVRGPASDISNVRNSAISAQLNAADFGIGINQGFLQLSTNSNLEIVSAQPLFIEVNVSSKEN
ncbi:MAG: hypothetical protein HFJ96_00435 [Peptococcaceae bacterium]|jgi:YbbR domain-containing protein|nr:hypothetical protein [Peptococcaceae bacterium]